jgi:hypothetical protein
MLAHEHPPARVNDLLSMSAARLDALADQVADGLAHSGLGDSAIGRRESWSPPPAQLSHDHL